MEALWEISKYGLTGLLCILLPVYRRYYGMQNFLWLSDIGLFLTVLALWLQSTLIMSIAAVGVLVVELLWCVDFIVLLFFRIRIIKLADYMFDAQYPLALRLLSLFHILVPALWIIYFMQYPYDPRALYYFVPLYWAIIGVTYVFTDPKENINWVFTPQAFNVRIASFIWLFILGVGFPLCIVLPSHYLLQILSN